MILKKLTPKEYTQEILDNGYLKEDEEIIDDFIYCKKCKTLRMCYLEEYSTTCPCTCKCQQEENAIKKELEEKQRQFERYNNLIKQSLLNPKFKDLTFETLDLEGADETFLTAKKRCEVFVEKWNQVREEGLGFYIYGNSGLGKTALTVCVGKKLLNRYIPVMFSSFIEIIKQIQASYNDKSNISEMSLIRELTRVPLLIVDDLGAERLNKFQNETIYYIIDTRYKEMMPTIFSSNYSLNELLEQGLEQRTVDRINEMSTAVMKLTGANYRKKIVAKKQGIF